MTMMNRRHCLRLLPMAATALLLGACASLPRSEPLQVTVGGVEPLPGEGMELRMLLKLRVQNPNDAAIDYDGVSVELEVQDKTFATGVSGDKGTVPGFGEAVIAVPVTVSMMRMARQVMGALEGEPLDKIRYDMSGTLSGTGMQSYRFRANGELTLPAAGR